MNPIAASSTKGRMSPLPGLNPHPGPHGWANILACFFSVSMCSLLANICSCHCLTWKVSRAPQCLRMKLGWRWRSWSILHVSWGTSFFLAQGPDTLGPGDPGASGASVLHEQLVLSLESSSPLLYLPNPSCVMSKSTPLSSEEFSPGERTTPAQWLLLCPFIAFIIRIVMMWAPHSREPVPLPVASPKPQ